MSTLTKDSYVAAHACGCITAWISVEHSSPTELGKFMREHAKDGKTVEHVALDAIRHDPLMFPKECPHDPKGWERPKPKPYEPKIRWKKVRTHSAGIRRVYVTTPWHRNCAWFEAKRDEGKWWTTDGWFEPVGHSAGNGGGDKPARVFGPFDTQKAAGEWIAEQSMVASRASWLASTDRTEEEADEMLRSAERWANA